MCSSDLDALARAPAGNQAGAIEHLEVPGGAGLRKADEHRQFGDAPIAADEFGHDAKPGPVPKTLQHALGFEPFWIHCASMHTICFD